MKNKLQLIRQIIKEETSKFIKKKKLLEEKSILINKLNRLNEQWNPDDDNKIGYMGEGDSDGRAEDRYWKNTATSAERFSGDEEDGDSFDMRDSGSDEYSGKEFLERELKSEKIRFKDFPVYYDSSTPDVGGVEFGQLLIPNGHIFILFKNNDDIEIRKYNGDKVKNFNLEVDSVGDVITYIKQLQGNFISETKKLVKTKMLKEDNGSLRATLHTLVGNEMKLGKRADMHGGVDWQVEEHKKAEKELEMFLLQNPSMLEFVEEVEEHFLKRLYR
jgi:hypothetical protein